MFSFVFASVQKQLRFSVEIENKGGNIQYTHYRFSPVPKRMHLQLHAKMYATIVCINAELRY